MRTRAADDRLVRRPDNLDRLLDLLDRAQVERLWAACRADSAAPYRALLGSIRVSSGRAAPSQV